MQTTMADVRKIKSTVNTQSKFTFIDKDGSSVQTPYLLATGRQIACAITYMEGEKRRFNGYAPNFFNVERVNKGGIYRSYEWDGKHFNEV